MVADSDRAADGAGVSNLSEGKSSQAVNIRPGEESSFPAQVTATQASQSPASQSQVSQTPVSQTPASQTQASQVAGSEVGLGRVCEGGKSAVVAETFGPCGISGKDKSATPQKPKLLDQVRHRCRILHYSKRTEEAYVGWIRKFIRFHSLRHPAEMGGAAC